MEGMLILYKTRVRPILDYCIPVWRPYTKKDMGQLEKVQKRLTKMIAGCKGKTYEQRLTKLGLTTLEERFERSDMIQVYKVLNDKQNVYPVGFLKLSERIGRSHCKRLYKKTKHIRGKQKQFHFSSG